MVGRFFFYSFLCFVLLISRCFSSSFEHYLCSPTEASALLQFKQHFEITSPEYSCPGASLPKTMSWNESRDCCTWDEVTCDMLTGHVIGLDLSCSQLHGSIHPNSSLFQLHHLQTLNLAYNDFNYSSIPRNIGQLRNLRHLNLSYSHFDGKIPTKISYLSNLVSLDLCSSYEYGLQFDERTFETVLQNLTNLEVVSLSRVNISSLIPMNISSSLRYVDLTLTNTRGVLTKSFFLLPNLENLKLGHNYITGHIPNSIGNLKQIRELDLTDNHFTGHILDSIGNLTQIRELFLYANYFTGHIPDSIGNLTQIRKLILSNNHFTGHIPDSIGNLTQIRKLYLSENHFTGHIPDSIGNLTQISDLTLFQNYFTGHIPDSIGNLTLIRELDLSYNNITGHIPDSIDNLTQISYLILSYNHFTGHIPDSIGNLTQISYLILSHNHFTSHIPDFIGNLTQISYLDLSYSSLNGTIPSWLSLNHNQLSGSFPQSLAVTNITFPNLEYLFLSSCELKNFPHFLRYVKTLLVLDVSNNMIRGQIPNWFSSMRWDSLEYLNISHNSLIGHLPQFHYYNLQYLDLKFNSLHGSLPSSICNMNNLEFLDLSRNNFSNSIPSCLGSMDNLTVLDLRRNNFTGSLPPLCAQNTYLRTIILNGNQFEGTLPVSLLNCHGLEVLDVGNNAINETFPVWLGTLQELQVLILKSNVFHGPISTCQTKFCFPKLRIFDLSHNEFSGSLPAKVFGNFKAMIKLDGEDTGEIKYMEQANMSSYISYEDSVSLVIKGQVIELERISTIMTTIDLSGNHFEGDIPKSLKDLSSLWLLNLSRNNLTGDIPMELGQLNTLEALDLSWNRLTGKIPQELTKLNYLGKFNLSQNLLAGPIPQGLQFNTFENDSYGGNLDLCGTPLSKQCGTSDPSHVPQPLEEEEDESYFFSGFTWESVVIGYSFGLVVGTVMCSFMFKVGKPKWFVEFFEGIIPQERRRTKKRRPRQQT